MKFPGRRKYTHFFPVHARGSLGPMDGAETFAHRTRVVGVDQTLVDIEARVDDELLERYGLVKGQSLVLDAEACERLYEELSESGRIAAEHAGGTVGNTLHNYSMLSDDDAVLLGVMSGNIQLGTSGYRYLCNTSSRVDLDHLQPVDGAIGRCLALITPDGERSFAISEGCMNQLEAASVPESVITAGIDRSTLPGPSVMTNIWPSPTMAEKEAKVRAAERSSPPPRPSVSERVAK